MSGATRLFITAALLLGGCATDVSRVSEYVDSQTGVTVRAMASPFVYALDGQAVAHDAGDYVSVGAVEVNKMGTYQQYLAVVPWTRTDHSGVGAPAVSRPERIALTLGGQPRELLLATHEPRSLGVSEPPFRPGWGYIGESWYAVTPADLRAFAAAPPDSIQLIEGGRILTYIVFNRADAALQEFVRTIPDTVTSEPHRR